MAHEKTADGFIRTRGRWDVLDVAFGAMIGFGWIVLTGGFLEGAGPLGAALAFVLGGIVVSLVGLTYAELVSAMPHVGGEHNYVLRAMGSRPAFFTSWTLVLGYVSVVAFEAVALPQTMLYLFPDMLAGRMWTVAGYDVYATWAAVGIVAAIVMTGLNYIGVRPAAVFQSIAVLFLLAVGAALLLGSFVGGSTENMDPLITGGVAGRITEPFNLFGWVADREESYFYVVLAYVVVMFVAAANLMRTRDGRALVAVRDHYLSAEMMGINLAYYRTLSFGIASFYAGIGGLKVLLGRSAPIHGNGGGFWDGGPIAHGWYGIAYPSGHAAEAVLIYGAAAYLILAYAGPDNRLRRRLTWLVGLIAANAIVVAFYLGFHWPTDLIAGLLAGGLVLRLIVNGDRALTRRGLPFGWSYDLPGRQREPEAAPAPSPRPQPVPVPAAVWLRTSPFDLPRPSVQHLRPLTAQWSVRTPGTPTHQRSERELQLH